MLIKRASRGEREGLTLSVADVRNLFFDQNRRRLLRRGQILVLDFVINGRIHRTIGKCTRGTLLNPSTIYINWDRSQYFFQNGIMPTVGNPVEIELLSCDITQEYHEEFLNEQFNEHGGAVYILVNHTANIFKIGSTTNVVQRLQSIRHSHPNQIINLIDWVQIPTFREAEYWLHQELENFRFRDQAVIGNEREWYRLNAVQFTRLTLMMEALRRNPQYVLLPEEIRRAL